MPETTRSAISLLLRYLQLQILHDLFEQGQIAFLIVIYCSSFVIFKEPIFCSFFGSKLKRNKHYEYILFYRFFFFQTNDKRPRSNIKALRERLLMRHSSVFTLTLCCSAELGEFFCRVYCKSVAVLLPERNRL